MKTDYVSYHSEKLGFAVLSLSDSIGDIRAVLGSTGKLVDFVRMKAKQFDSIGYLRADDGRMRALNSKYGTMNPQDAVARMLSKKLPITKPALERIEAMFETKGKSTEQIRTEIVRISESLPKGHALRAVPPKFSDRGQAISTYTQMRQTLFQLSKEKQMSTEAATETTPAKPKKASTKAEAKKPSKAKATSNGEAKVKKATAPVEKKERKPREEAPSAYKLAGPALEAKDIGDLKMHEGSARAQVMSVLLGNKKRKNFTAEDFSDIEGATAALNYCMKRGWLAAA